MKVMSLFIHIDLKQGDHYLFFCLALSLDFVKSSTGFDTLYITCSAFEH